MRSYFFSPVSREAAFFPARIAGAAEVVLNGLAEGRSLWGKPGLGGFEPARGGAPIEAAVFAAVKELKIRSGVKSLKWRKCLIGLGCFGDLCA